ncbi:MAG: GDP-mannose 4,6-dehydratase [Candidatus Helarchaeota archaeon]
MKKCLVTGGLGFIGTNLCDFLLSETTDHIIIYDNASRKDVLKNKHWLERKHNTSRLQILQKDIRDIEDLKSALKDVETIYHLAGQVAVTTSIMDPLEDFEINAKGTLNLLECARKLETDPVFIMTSTNKIYGALEQIQLRELETRYEFQDLREGVDETFPVDPYSPYGCSKYSAESYVKDYQRIYGLKTVVFRMSCIYGYHQFGTEDQGWIAHFIISSLLNKRLTIYGDGKQVRDILFIGDLIKAFQAALKNIKRTKGNVYNIGGGFSNTISLLELKTMLESVLNRAIPTEFQAWRPGDQKVYYSNTQKAQHDFSWKPYIAAKEGIEKLCKWIQTNIELFEG